MVFVVFFPTGAKAQEAYRAINEEEVAILYSRLIGEQPPFEDWVRVTEEYREAPVVEKRLIMNREVARLRSVYSSVSALQLVTVQYKTKLSSYNKKHNGYFLYLLDDNFYLPFKYANKHYVIIPQGIDSYQWIYMPENRVQMAESLLGEDREVIVEISMTTAFADAKSPLTIDKIDHWPILTEVVELRVWNTELLELIWTIDFAKDDFAFGGSDGFINEFEDF